MSPHGDWITASVKNPWWNSEKVANCEDCEGLADDSSNQGSPTQVIQCSVVLSEELRLPGDPKGPPWNPQGSPWGQKPHKGLLSRWICCWPEGQTLPCCQWGGGGGARWAAWQNSCSCSPSWGGLGDRWLFQTVRLAQFPAFSILKYDNRRGVHCTQNVHSFDQISIFSPSPPWFASPYYPHIAARHRHRGTEYGNPGIIPPDWNGEPRFCWFQIIFSDEIHFWAKSFDNHCWEYNENEIYSAIPKKWKCYKWYNYKNTSRLVNWLSLQQYC